MNSKEDGILTAMLLELEHQLMDPVFRKDREQVSALLAPEFREFGSSGRVWTRAAILDLLATETPRSAPAVEDFTTRIIGPDTVLVTYRTVQPDRQTLRSSIWMRSDSGWQMHFHQGTRTPE
jgi:hypothetical protein